MLRALTATEKNADQHQAGPEGFDRAKTSESEDRLGRRRIAHRAYQLLTELPTDWSVRVGLFGEWGEGKTTVCNWVAKLADADDHITVWYNPWSASSATDLWIGFATKLLQTLDERGIALEGAVRLRATLGIRKWGDIPKKTADIAKVTQAMAGTGFAMAEGFLRIGPDDLARLQAGLGSHRLVVIIDDLDRTDPALLPQLLLALREILDLPGFSFLLPLDPTVIAHALAGYNPAWGRGERFLDKILDFRIALPPASVEHRRAMFLDELATHCPFVPAGEIADLDDTLPGNPRKLKALVRNLMVYRGEAERHGPGELDWRSILFASMIRMESEVFYAAFIQATFADALNPGAAAPAEHSSAELDKLIEAHAPADEPTRARLRPLAMRWWEHCARQGVDRVAFQMRLAEQPGAVSWREFRRFYDLWSGSRSLEGMAEAVADHATGLGQPPPIVAADVAFSLLAYYEDRLYAAAYVELAEEHTAMIAEALDSLQLLATLCRQGLPGTAPPINSPDLFERMLDVALTWAEFEANPSDAQARERERTLLADMVAAAGDETLRFVGIIEARRQAHARSQPRARRLADLLIATAGWQRDQILARLAADQGLADLYAADQNRSLKAAMFDPEGQLWKTAEGEETAGAAVLKKAETEPAVQKNALELLRLVLSATDRGVGINPDLARRFAATPAITKIWQAATARPLQARNQQQLRDMRTRLFRLGAADDALPLPDWFTGR